MEFQKIGDLIVSYWTPKDAFQGWTNILHGGIQATLMDEIGSWFAIVTAQTSGVTTHLNVKYRKAVAMDKGPIKLEASLHEFHGRIMVVQVKLYDGAGTLCSEAQASYYMMDPDKARDQFEFPGINAFLE